MLGHGAFGSTLVIVDRHFGMPICSEGMWSCLPKMIYSAVEPFLPFACKACNRTGARPWPMICIVDHAQQRVCDIKYLVWGPIVCDRRWSSWMSKCHVSDMHKSFTPNAMSGTPPTLFRCDLRQAAMHVNLHACTCQTRTSSHNWNGGNPFFFVAQGSELFPTYLVSTPPFDRSARCRFRGGDISRLDTDRCVQ